jgi:predicted nucleotidyltransferase
VDDKVFGETLCEIPVDQIAEIYHPTKKLTQLKKSKELSPLEAKALQLATSIKEKANIPWNSIGISGSIMAGLATPNSDIDPIIYGEANSRKAYTALLELRETSNSGFKPYANTELKTLFEFRSKDTKMSFQDFQRVESRKAFQGMFLGVEYFVRFVKDWTEVEEQYGDAIFRNEGYCKIEATVLNDNDALFTPCTYKLEDVRISKGPKLTPIEEIVSFRGRFCMQASSGDRVEAEGKVEEVTYKNGQKHYRIILGNKPQDYMVLRT